MNRLVSRCLCLAVAMPLALSAPSLRAEHRGEMSEQDFLTELPVVLSASRLAQPLSDAPGAVTVIDRDMIKASGAREIADLFRFVPGFQASYANGANPVVNYHGLTGQFNPYMQVLVDGRPYYSPYYVGGVNWNMLPVSLDDIERIEVVRGSNSAAYGANAFLGVANIITRDPTQTHGGLASVTLGDQGIRDNVFRYGGAAGGLDYRFTAGRREDSGFNDVYDAKHVSYVNFRGDLRLDAQDMLHVYFGANENSAGAGFAGNLDNPPRTQLASHYFAQMQWRRVLGPDEELSLTGYHVQDWGGENYATLIESFNPFLPPATYPIQLDWGRRSDQTSIELQQILRLNPAVRLVWGLGHRFDRVRSRLLFSNDDWQEARLSRAFGNLEWRAQPWLLVNAGAMAERYSLTGTHVSPRLMLNVQPDRDHTVRLGASKAIRTPSLLEDKGNLKVFSDGGQFLGWFFLGRGDLRPERVLTRELSYLGEFRQYAATLDLRLFDERLSDLVATEPMITDPTLPLPAARIFQNAYHAHIRGVEYEARWRPLPGTAASLSQAFVRIRDVNRLNPGDTTADDMMKSAPTHRTTIFLSSSLPDNWQASLAHHWVGATVWPAEGDPVPKYRRLDLRLARSFKMNGYRAEAAVTTQNVFAPYAEFRPQYPFTRRSFATLGLEF